LEAFVAGEVDDSLATAAEEVVAVRNPPLPDAGVYAGRAGVLQMWREWAAEFGALEMEIRQIVWVRRGRVIAEVTQRGVGRLSGAEVVGQFWLLFTIEDGLVVKLDAFASETDALEATL